MDETNPRESNSKKENPADPIDDDDSLSDDDKKEKKESNPRSKRDVNNEIKDTKQEK